MIKCNAATMKNKYDIFCRANPSYVSLDNISCYIATSLEMCIISFISFQERLDSLYS